MDKTIVLGGVFLVVTILWIFTQILVGVQFTVGQWVVPKSFLLAMRNILVSFYPFTLLFYLLNSCFFDSAKKQKKSIYNWTPVLHWGVMFSIPAHFCALFGFHLPVLKSFLVAVGICVVVPVVVYAVFRLIQVRYAGIKRTSADRLASIAQRYPPFEQFLEKAGAARIFVTDTERQFTHARVCALHRFVRPEEPAVIQDTVFEVQVDMRRKRVVEDSEVFQTYLFKSDEQNCSALALPIQYEDWRPGEPTTIAPPMLAQLESSPRRFPNLDRYPLPIASRNIDAVEVSAEEGEVESTSPVYMS